MKRLQQQISTLTTAKNDRIRRYGGWMPGILDLIKRKARDFHRQPIGPLGISSCIMSRIVFVYPS